MGGLDLVRVAAANDAWVMAPAGSQIMETAEYRLVRLPERFPDPLALQWVRSKRPAEAVLVDIVERAAEFGLPEAYIYSKLSAPDGFDVALLARGARMVDATDVLAMPLPADVTMAEPVGLQVQWRTTLEVARDANTVQTAVFGGSRASDDEVAALAAAARESVAVGAGGIMVGYLDAVPVAVGGLDLVDGVARLWGGGVLESHRGRGAYRALVAARLRYAIEHGATMALTQGRVATSSPILQRMGFTPYGLERHYRLPSG